MVFPAITITSSTPFVFNPRWLCRLGGHVAVLEIYNNAGGADLYYGDEPAQAVSISGYSQPGTNGKTSLGKNKGVLLPNTPGWNDIRPGYVFSCVDSVGDDGKYVVEVNENEVIMNTAMTITPDGYAIAFTPPSITSTNGFIIPSGTGKSFTSDHNSRWLDGKLRLIVPSGTATVRLRYKIL